MTNRNGELELIPAGGLTLGELTELYNRTRADYLVPMPMNAARLSAYIDRYDVDLSCSQVAVRGNRALGLGLLGLRRQRGWITRLGVVPTGRLRGVGARLTEGLLRAAAVHGIDRTVLEVIRGNRAAERMFHRFGFREVRELLILERRSQEPPPSAPGTVSPMSRQELLALAGEDREDWPWTVQGESLRNRADLAGLRISTHAGDLGWLLYVHRDATLICLACGTEAGDPGATACGLLSHLHRAHPADAARFENLPVDDPHAAAFIGSGYVEVFRRVEMWRLGDGSESTQCHELPRAREKRLSVSWAGT